MRFFGHSYPKCPLATQCEPMTADNPKQIFDNGAQLPALGARLQGLFDVIATASAQQRYDHIWDCCCDHGYLGFHLLRADMSGCIHFVDQMPHLINDIALRFKQDPLLNTFPDDSYQLTAIDAGLLQFERGSRHMALFAGVGGELTIQLLDRISTQHTQQAIDFVFCPSTTQYDLREYLHLQGYELLHEGLVSEKGRQYEIIWARNVVNSSPENSRSVNRVSPTGDWWDANNPEHCRYLNKLIRHYQNRLQRDPTGRAQYILNQYHHCLDNTPSVK